MTNPIRCIKERFLSWECFINGARYESPRFWSEKDARERAEYAEANPWVFRYDFGHKELVAKSKLTVI